MNLSGILKPFKRKLRSATKSKKKLHVHFNTSSDSSIAESSQNSSALSEALDISDYLEYEWFDLEPKTDYTYSRSVSYSHVKANKPYISPNMSRRRLHGDSSLLGSQESPKKTVPTSSHWLRSREKVTDFDTPQSSEADSFSSYLSENNYNEHLEDNQSSTKQTSSSVINRRRSSNNNDKSQHESSNSKTITTITNTVTEIYEALEGQMEKGMKEAKNSKSRQESQALAASSSNTSSSTSSSSSSTAFSSGGTAVLGLAATTASSLPSAAASGLAGSAASGLAGSAASGLAGSAASGLAGSTASGLAGTAGSRQFTKETVTTDYIIRDRSADIYHHDKSLHYGQDSNISSRYRQQSTSSNKSNNASAYNEAGSEATTSEKSSGYLSSNSNTSEKSFLGQKMAAAAAALASAGSYFTKDTATTVNHMYGLDSDTEYDYDEIHGKSSAAAKASTSSVSSPYYTGAKKSATTNASNDGFLRSTAKGAKRFCTKTVTTVVEVVEWLTLGTTSTIASVFTSRRLCCCCLPLLLLLLLPLLLTGLWAIAGLDRTNTTTIINQLTMLPFIKERKPEVIYVHKEGGVSESHLALEKQVAMLILQLQETREKQNEQLSRADVEAMMKSMSAEQLALFMGHLNKNDGQHQEQLELWKKEQLTHFEGVNEKMKVLIEKAEALNIELAATKNSLEGQSSASGDNKDKILLLEESLHTLVGEFGHLKDFQHEYYNLFKNCCKNATAIQSHIKEEVYAALMKVLGGNAGGDSGTAESVVQQTLTTWLHDNYISRSELDSQLGVMAKTLTKKLQDMLAKEKPNDTVYLSGINSGISESFVRALVDEALVKFSADKTGMADFALESGGGSVISTRCSETFTKKTALVSMFGIPLFYKSNSPRTAIQPDVNPGECWAFKGSIGTLVIQLSRKVKIEAFSMEHISKSISPHGRIDSAPKDFSVYSLLDLNDKKGECLGNYTYKDDGRPLQQFPVQVQNAAPTQLVEVRITSNQGNLEFTCLYRFRVHGVPDTS